MADQYTPAPAPSKTEFNTLNTQVQGLAEQIGFKALNVDTDFNTLTRKPYVQWYYGEWRTGHSNVPSISNGSPFTLEIIPIGTASYTKQILHIYGTTSITYMRTQGYNAGVVWGTWMQITATSV